MKNLVYFLIFGIVLSIVGCNDTGDKKSKTGIASGDSGKIEWVSSTHDFGTIKEGEIVSTVYEFKNVGSMPVEILDVTVTCGCTVAEKPEKPIGAGQKGQIKVNFNSTGKSGVNKKYVTVISNASNNNETVSFNVVVNNENEINK
jgi:hypothetical protein